MVTEIAEKKLQDGLTKVKSFTDNLKVDTSNLVNKSTNQHWIVIQ